MASASNFRGCPQHQQGPQPTCELCVAARGYNSLTPELQARVQQYQQQQYQQWRRHQQQRPPQRPDQQRPSAGPTQPRDNATNQQLLENYPYATELDIQDIADSTGPSSNRIGSRAPTAYPVRGPYAQQPGYATQYDTTRPSTQGPFHPRQTLYRDHDSYTTRRRPLRSITNTSDLNSRNSSGSGERIDEMRLQELQRPRRQQ